jgi:glutathione S-transferase
MPSIKLTYFDLRARAEPARLILAQAGQKYDDVRLPAPWDNIAPWQEMKPKTPFGQLPVLCFDGVEIAQSMAVARFLGREFGLAGATNVENALMDAAVTPSPTPRRSSTPPTSSRRMRPKRRNSRRSSTRRFYPVCSLTWVNLRHLNAKTTFSDRRIYFSFILLLWFSKK